VYADDQLRPWTDALARAAPGVRPFDAHTHTGCHDPDGFSCSVEQLLEALDEAGARAVVFTMHEPDGYPPANDRVLREAAASDGRLVPFCRLDPRARPVEEAERCLDAGARGIKLHPRAERFRLEEPETEPIFALANERRVPVLVHAGRGIPALGRDALELCERFPDTRIILAHAAVCDLAWIWRHAADHPNLFFDTAWWSAVDLLTLFSLVPPGQILFGSDAPYGTPIHSSLLAMRCALQAGVTPEQLVAVMGGQLERLLAREAPLDLGPAPGTETVSRDLVLERLHAYLTTALGRMLGGEDAGDQLGLARLACEVGDDAPQAPVGRSVLSLLDRFDRYRAEFAETGEAGRSRRFPGLHLIVIAAVVALTPDVALPAEPEPVAAGERSP
jgi:predicted TIM-barrel fold metal-dependent hydrolase